VPSRRPGSRRPVLQSKRSDQHRADWSGKTGLFHHHITDCNAMNVAPGRAGRTLSTGSRRARLHRCRSRNPDHPTPFPTRVRWAPFLARRLPRKPSRRALLLPPAPEATAVRLNSRHQATRQHPPALKTAACKRRQTVKRRRRQRGARCPSRAEVLQVLKKRPTVARHFSASASHHTCTM